MTQTMERRTLARAMPPRQVRVPWLGLRGRRISWSAAAISDQLHRWLAHPGVAGGSRTVEALAPGQGRDVAVLVHGFVRDEPQPLPQRCSGVWVGAVIEQKAGEGAIPLQSAKVRLRDDAGE